MATRLNGFSTPFFGLSWTPATSDLSTARGVLLYLQGHRLLYDSHAITELAGLDRIEVSIREIRSFLSDTLVKGGIGDELSSSLQAMRAACMNFLAAIDRYRDWMVSHQADPRDFEFYDARDPVLEDEQANAVLFRHSVRLTMHFIAQAYDIPSPGMR